MLSEKSMNKSIEEEEKAQNPPEINQNLWKSLILHQLQFSWTLSAILCNSISAHEIIFASRSLHMQLIL